MAWTARSRRRADRRLWALAGLFDRGPTSMSDRVRNAVLLIVLGVWVIVIAAYLVQGKLPDAALVGIPAAVILALGRRREDPAPPEPPAPTGQQPATEGDAA